MLVDSGSEKTYLMKGDAEILGLQFEKDKDGVSDGKVKAHGAGAKFDCNFATVDKISIMKNDEPFCIFENVRIRVPMDKEAIPCAVLGRDYLFKKFDITFHEGLQRMTFMPSLSTLATGQRT